MVINDTSTTSNLMDAGGITAVNGWIKNIVQSIWEHTTFSLMNNGSFRAVISRKI